uniref:Carboxypeptidase VC_A0337 n=2 Tax=Cacopsylla melanoneura TaxID=428564 RepID=A0A8D9A0F3_9HEMI
MMGQQFKSGDTIAFVANSNPVLPTKKAEIQQLTEFFQSQGIKVKESPLLYEQSQTNVRQKAMIMNQFFADTQIRAIFDVSGGDRANEILPYLDYDKISNSPVAFYGYSDLTVVLNALIAKAQRIVTLWQVRTILMDQTGIQKQKMVQSFFHDQSSLYQVKWEFVQGDQMQGVLIGGNIRCFLKLAGTPYQPSLEGKIIFLEAMSGNRERLLSYFHQLTQLQGFYDIAGILLGTFTEYQQNDSYPIDKLVKEVIGTTEIPITKTNKIGHASTAQALVLGKHYHIRKGTD